MTNEPEPDQEKDGLSTSEAQHNKGSGVVMRIFTYGAVVYLFPVFILGVVANPGNFLTAFMERPFSLGAATFIVGGIVYAIWELLLGKPPPRAIAGSRAEPRTDESKS